MITDACQIPPFHQQALQDPFSETKDSFSHYLKNPDQAPPVAEWIDKKNADQKTPLQVCMGDKFLAWEQDPFCLLIDKGADVNVELNGRTVLEQVCAHGTLAPVDERPIWVARAKKLLQAGAKIPPEKSYLYIFSFLYQHCAKELLARAQQGDKTVQTELLLPDDWAPPAWFPPIKELTAPAVVATNLKVSSIYEKAISTLTKAVRACKRELDADAWLPVRMASAMSVGSYLLYGNEWPAVFVHCWGAIITLSAAAIYFKAGLNDHDLLRLQGIALQNPLYKELCQRVVAEGPVTLVSSKIDFFLRPGITARDRVSLARCTFEEREITIYKGLDNDEALRTLIFETANLYQAKRFELLEVKWHQGLLAREEYVQLIERAEYDTGRICNQIIDYGNKYFGWLSRVNELGKSFKFDWLNANIRSAPERCDSHADGYRYKWENSFSFLYYLRNPEQAPKNSDWVNEKNTSNLMPLERCAVFPHLARLWDVDPFFQLIDKGAHVNQGMALALICHMALRDKCTPEDHAVCVIRAKRLLQANVKVENFSKEWRNWLTTLLRVLSDRGSFAG